jgi:hypothetical protein
VEKGTSTKSQPALWTQTISALRSLGRLRKRLQIIFTLAGTAIASLLQLFAKASTDPTWVSAANIASGVVIFAVLIVNLLLLLAETDSAAILAAAHDSEEKCSLLGAKIASLDALSNTQQEGLKWLSVLYSTSLALRDFVGPLVTRPLDAATKKQRFDEMLDVVLSQKTDLFGIGDERFNFAIYLPDTEQKVLNCFSCRRRDRADEESAHRAWPVGHGHVAKSFLDGKELIASDVKDVAIEAYFRAPADLARPDDSERYRSMAAVPIMIGAAKPLGVLIATSDIPGRFRPKAIADSRDTVEPLRVLASTLAVVLLSNDVWTQKFGGAKHDKA